MHDYSDGNTNQTYLDHVGHGFILCIEAISKGFRSCGVLILCICGVPFYLISKLSKFD